MLVYEQRAWGEDRTQILVPRSDLGEHKTTEHFKRAMRLNPPASLKTGIYVCIPESCIASALLVNVKTQTVIEFEENKPDANFPAN